MRRRAIPAIALVIALVFALLIAPGLGPPGHAEADPNVPDAKLRAAVTSINTRKHVHDIITSKAVEPLESEESSGSRVTVRISADVLFDFDKATLTSAARKRIGSLASRLRQVTGTIEVSGHTDDVGEPGYNQDLSTRRAEAVKAELERLLGGASGAGLQATGFGETKPVAPNRSGGKDNPSGRAKNRRVDITFLKS